MILWQAQVEFGVQILSGVDSHLQTSRNKVFAHLQDTFLHLGRILGIYYVLLETIVINFLCLLLIGKHQESLVVLAKNVINVDTDQDFNLGYIAQLFTQLEIAR